MGVRRRAPDFLLFLSVLALLCVGLVMVFSASVYYAGDPRGPFNDPFYFFKRQFIYALLGLIAMFVTMNIDYWKYAKYKALILLTAFAFLILVLLPGIGASYLGAQRWLNLGPVSFQPSEFVKLCIIIFTAYGLAAKKEQVRNFTKGVLPFIIIGGFASILILMQPDLGTAATLMSTLVIMCFVAGARGKQLGGLCGFGLAMVTAAIWVEPYRRKRFFAFLDPEADPTGAGWHIINSLMSLGSGGFMGTGLGQGRHSKFLFLPERHTDFIFAAIGEELGFIGSFLVIMLFVIFLWRGLKVAITSSDNFGSLLAAGIVSGICLQAIINIGVVTSSLPVTGITLPFVSYGGTSLVFTLMSTGILLNISRHISSR
ncbi:MAG: putative lipid II flippase FtsW [Clostridiales bacterium]|nr:putative lipid II flippase FtsW [Clostridiales bacterium]MCF8021362.1 putative lipid II flippase FtsW [Clostridiales bacterium]